MRVPDEAIEAGGGFPMVPILVINLLAISSFPCSTEPVVYQIGASAPSQVVTSNRWMRLDGLVASGLGGEAVVLKGRTHVQTRVTFPNNPLDPTRIDAHTNLAQVEGTGQTTGLRYRVAGAASMDPYFSPAGPLTVPAFVLQYREAPTPPPGGPIPLPYPLTLRYILSFDSNGNLDESAVEIHSP